MDMVHIIMLKSYKRKSSLQRIQLTYTLLLDLKDEALYLLLHLFIIRTGQTGSKQIRYNYFGHSNKIVSQPKILREKREYMRQNRRGIRSTPFGLL